MVPSYVDPTVEKGEEEGTEAEVVDVAEEEEGGLVELEVPSEEGVRLDSATEEE